MFVFLMLFLTVGINVSRPLLGAFGVEKNYLFVTLIAVVVAGLLVHRRLLLILLVVGLAAVVNLPVETLENYNISRTILLASLMAIVLLPAMGRFS